MRERRRTDAQGWWDRACLPSSLGQVLPVLSVAVLAVGGAWQPAGATRAPAARPSTPCEGMWRPSSGPPPARVVLDGPKPDRQGVQAGDRLRASLASEGTAYLCVGSPGKRPVAVPFEPPRSPGSPDAPGHGPARAVFKVPHLPPGSEVCVRAYVVSRPAGRLPTDLVCVVVAGPPDASRHRKGTKHPDKAPESSTERAEKQERSSCGLEPPTPHDRKSPCPSKPPGNPSKDARPRSPDQETPLSRPAPGSGGPGSGAPRSGGPRGGGPTSGNPRGAGPSRAVPDHRPRDSSPTDSSPTDSSPTDSSPTDSSPRTGDGQRAEDGGGGPRNATGPGGKRSTPGPGDNPDTTGARPGPGGAPGGSGDGPDGGPAGRGSGPGGSGRSPGGPGTGKTDGPARSPGAPGIGGPGSGGPGSGAPGIGGPGSGGPGSGGDRRLVPREPGAPDPRRTGTPPGGRNAAGQPGDDQGGAGGRAGRSGGPGAHSGHRTAGPDGSNRTGDEAGQPGGGSPTGAPGPRSGLGGGSPGGRDVGGRDVGGRDADGRDADGRDVDGRDVDGRGVGGGGVGGSGVAPGAGGGNRGPGWSKAYSAPSGAPLPKASSAGQDALAAGREARGPVARTGAEVELSFRWAIALILFGVALRRSVQLRSPPAGT